MFDGELSYTRVLTIAGSDSGGGAGIQADLKTFSALGCFGMSALTAITAQNTKGVDKVYPLPSDIVEDQIKSVISDIGVDAIKIGMLHTPAIVESVHKMISDKDIVGNVPIVLDTVMMDKSGEQLLLDEAVDALKSLLFPLVTVLTPNIPEAIKLIKKKIRSPDEMEFAAKDLTTMGPKAVVLKGGHLEDDMSDDCLVMSDESGETVRWFQAKRVRTQNTHGTGCTYSAAIAAFLAKGYSIEDAVNQSKRYLTDAIYAGAKVKIGSGHGPVHHMHSYWQPGH
ncbi:MAG: bifunctional hydroxymethylpyrimidine kinase/phosphomethylpyrimidine kinase [Alphaproteobacteria bacterium 43-37]|nr:MAG: bifunctional hydroxymethylpyrimidine kinase/phosphomethylpyrimidine kinase [Alphaproteobacteria bacterium 43-37]